MADVTLDDLLDTLAVSDAAWVTTTSGVPRCLIRGNLQRIPKIVCTLIHSSLMPINHNTQIVIKRLILAYGIIQGKPIDAAALIAREIYEQAQRMGEKNYFPFPFLITKLIKSAGVRIPTSLESWWKIEDVGSIDLESIKRILGSKDEPKGKRQRVVCGPGESSQAAASRPRARATIQDVAADTGVIRDSQRRTEERLSACEERIAACEEGLAIVQTTQSQILDTLALMQANQAETQATLVQMQTAQVQMQVSQAQLLDILTSLPHFQPLGSIPPGRPRIPEAEASPRGSPVRTEPAQRTSPPAPSVGSARTVVLPSEDEEGADSGGRAASP